MPVAQNSVVPASGARGSRIVSPGWEHVIPSGV